MALYRLFKKEEVRQISAVPDAGHARLIALFRADPEVACYVLTTKEEGIAIAAGAWLGGQRSGVLMQSSGVGNCIDMLSLSNTGRFPLLILVTMRVDMPQDLIATVGSAARLAYGADQQVAVIVSQRLLEVEQW